MYTIKGYWTDKSEIDCNVSEFGFTNESHIQWESDLKFQSKELAIKELEKVVGNVIIDDIKNSERDNGHPIRIYANKTHTKWGIQWFDDCISSYAIKTID